MFEIVLTLALLTTKQACYCVSPIPQEWHSSEAPLKKRYDSMEKCLAALHEVEQAIVPRPREETGVGGTVRGSRCQIAITQEL